MPRKHGRKRSNWIIIWILNLWTMKISGKRIWGTTCIKTGQIFLQLTRKPDLWLFKLLLSQIFQWMRVRKSQSYFLKTAKAICMILGNRAFILTKTSSMEYSKIKADPVEYSQQSRHFSWSIFYLAQKCPFTTLMKRISKIRYKTV